MLISLKGSWGLVLGASSGIGRACALALAAEGVNVIGVHFGTAAAVAEADRLAGEIRAHGVQAHLFNANAARAATRDLVVRTVREVAGADGVRVLLHSIAFGSLLPYLPRAGWPDRMSQRQLEMTVDVMAHSLVYWVQDLVAAQMLPRGAKVFAMTSAGSAQVLPSYGAVAAAKCALESHVRQLACELAPLGVAVNALRAGVTVTQALRRIPEHPTFVAQAGSRNPHGRLTTPQDVGEAVVLLSRTDSSWITGNVIGVDGGELIAADGAWHAAAAAPAAADPAAPDPAADGAAG
jgi:enoyl-[acyl-carrier protein] reductase III